MSSQQKKRKHKADVVDTSSLPLAEYKEEKDESIDLTLSDTTPFAGCLGVNATISPLSTTSVPLIATLEKKKKEVHLTRAFLVQQQSSPPDISSDNATRKLTKLSSVSARDPGYSFGHGKHAPVLLYLLQTKDRKGTYTGITNNPRRRMGSHNYCESNMHAYTAQKGRPWSCVATVKGFETRETAEQFEKLVKTYACESLPYVSAVDNRLYRILQVCRALIWDPLLIEVDANMEFHCLSVFTLPFYCKVEKTQWFKNFNTENHALGRSGWLAICKEENWNEDGSPLTSSHLPSSVNATEK